MTVLERIWIMLAILATQWAFIGFMILHPSNWITFLIIWHVLAAGFWWQALKAWQKI